MNIKIKETSKDNIIRIENTNEIKEVLINEDLFHPRNESISICFRNNTSSGIVDISPQEFEKIYSAVKNMIHLIKGFKKLSGGGAMKL